MSAINNYWQEGPLPSDGSNFAVAMFLVMVCTMEVIFLKLTVAPMFNRDVEYDNSSEYEEDIYYEELYNNSSLWPSRRRTQDQNGDTGYDDLDYNE